MEENGHAMQTEDNMEEMKESYDAEEDAELEDVQKSREGNLKKRGLKKATPKKPESKEPTTPLTDRPAREKKLIDRFADSVEKEKEKPKEFKIEQGSGTYLRDIPNVAFKLSKRKWSDESVQLLHKLLYNKRVKPQFVKANILQFSGCVWGANEEKEKSKMKEKLEKCMKENLWQVSDMLDLNITKTTKKEDLVMRVLEFLDCPHKTTEKLVQEEKQKSKEKKTATKGKKKKSSGQTPRKRQKHEAKEEVDQEMDEDEPDEVVQEEHEEPEEVPAKKKRSIKIKEPSRDAKSTSAKKPGKKSAKRSRESEDVEDLEEPVQEPEEVEKEPEEDHEEPKRKRSKNKKYDYDDVVPKSPKKGMRKPVKKKSVYEPKEEDLDENAENVKSKPLSKVSKKQAQQESKTPIGNSSKEQKNIGTSSSKASSRKIKKEDQEDDAPQEMPKKGRGASQSSAVKEEIKSTPIPPEEDLRAAICELLRDADFSTVTLTDVVKQLGAKFDVDFSQNKAHVKILIQEEISKIVEEDDGEGDDEDAVAAGVDTPVKEPIETAAD